MITEIGKIKIKWDVESKTIKNRLLSHYKNFIVNNGKKIDIKIKAQVKPSKEPSTENLILETRSWQYFKNKDKKNFYFPRLDKDNKGSLAEIARNYRNITFLSYDNYGQLLLYLFPEILYSLVLPEFKGILLHACGVKMGDRLFVFPALSGGGKSTLAKLALKKNITLLNDDRIILRKIDNKYFAFGNPWHGELEVTSRDYGEVKELFFLKKARKNSVKRVSYRDMFVQILGNSFYFKKDKDSFLSIVEIVSDIVHNIDGYTLGFKADENIWRYLNERFR